jgi:L-asparaginase
MSGLTKPIILTGSQRPLMEIRSDARINLINSIELATLDIPEVCICFNNVLFRGNRAKKISINDFDAYQSPNFKPLAEIGIKIQLSDSIWRSQGMFQILKKFDHSVMSFALFPGLNPNDLEILIQSSIRGIIFEGFGAGNVPILDNSFIPLIEKLTENKKIVAIKSQCVNGSTDLTLYEGGSRALAAGAISCGDMTREAAIVKMMFLLGNFNNISLIKENFCRSLIGELSIENE